MLQSYQTVKQEAEVTEIHKKSKFIARVKAVETLAEVDAFIAAVQHDYPDASHHVYAYSLGSQGQQQKYHDDGEPSGSAGVPVLEALKQTAVVNVAMVVTRYFGGTLLGRGGLVRAYGGAARAAIEQAGIVNMVPYQQVDIVVDYTVSDRVERELNKAGIAIVNTAYLAEVTFTICLWPSRLDEAYELVQERSAGQFLWEIGTEVLLPER